jgi:hypothetical protein
MLGKTKRVSIYVLRQTFQRSAWAWGGVAAAVPVPVVTLAWLSGDITDQGTRNTTDGSTDSCTAHVVGDCATNDSTGCRANASAPFRCSATCKG